MTELYLLRAMKVLFSLSLSGTLLFLLLHALLLMCQNRLSRFWQYYIWLIVCARFLLPVTPAVSVSGFLSHTLESAASKAIGFVKNSTDATAAPAGPISNGDGKVSKNAGLADKNAPKNAGLADENSPKDTTRGMADGNALKDNAVGLTDRLLKNAAFGLSLVWSAKALQMFLCRLIAYQRFCRSLKTQHMTVTDLEILNELSECMERLKIRRHVRLCRSMSAVSPMTAGFFHPYIVLPAKNISQKELHFIFMHELIHVKRQDLLYKWLAQAVICIHWFNPFARLLTSEINRACELSCDEAVLNLLKNKEDKKAYGDMLLSFVRTGTALGNPNAPIMLTEGAEQLKERLGAIMNHKKKTKTITAASAVLTAIACFWFTALGAYAAPLPSASSGMTMELKNKKNGQENYHYMNCQGFYCNSYLIELTWNIQEPAAYADSAVVSPDGQASMTVYFHKKAAKYAKDKKAIAAIGKAIVSAGDAYTEPVTRPAVLRMVYIPAAKIPAYTEKYYKKKDILGFATIFPFLDHTAKQSYAAKAYKTDDIAYFSIIVDDMDDAVMRLYAEKAVEDERVDVLMLLLDEIKLTPEEQRSYAKKAYDKDDIACFNVLADSFRKSVIRQYTERSIQDGKVDFLSVLLDHVKPSAADLDHYARTTYGQDDIACFRVLTDYMSSAEKRAWKKQAKKDGNLAFYHMLADK